MPEKTQGKNFPGLSSLNLDMYILALSVFRRFVIKQTNYNSED